MGEGILVCPACKPRAVRVTRPDGSHIPGFVPTAEYVGFRLVGRYFGAKKPPRQCPNCGSDWQRR